MRWLPSVNAREEPSFRFNMLPASTLTAAELDFPPAKITPSFSTLSVDSTKRSALSASEICPVSAVVPAPAIDRLESLPVTAIVPAISESAVAAVRLSLPALEMLIASPSARKSPSNAELMSSLEASTLMTEPSPPRSAVLKNAIDPPVRFRVVPAFILSAPSPNQSASLFPSSSKLSATS